MWIEVGRIEARVVYHIRSTVYSNQGLSTPIQTDFDQTPLHIPHHTSLDTSDPVTYYRYSLP